MTRRVATIAFAVVVAVAAVISYDHIRLTAGAHWWAFLIPLSVDGLMISGSISLWADRSNGERGGLLAWAAVAAGLFVSLWANAVQADPTPTGVVVAMWPPLALAIAFELLVRMARPEQDRPAGARDSSYRAPAETPAATTPPAMPAPVRAVGSSIAARARAWVLAELDAGREPTGADVDTALGLEGKARCGARAVRQILEQRERVS